MIAKRYSLPAPFVPFTLDILVETREEYTTFVDMLKNCLCASTATTRQVQIINTLLIALK